MTRFIYMHDSLFCGSSQNLSVTFAKLPKPILIKTLAYRGNP